MLAPLRARSAVHLRAPPRQAQELGHGTGMAPRAKGVGHNQAQLHGGCLAEYVCFSVRF